ncbi:BlaI/MecI/CopY family transcriptional regulator [Enterococcus sp. LJL120]|uniref:BlaI/MecI/CopY family transcriptional regulator n=1 Tax=Enterococcus sp. HY326 TaxID=2971265 RepID=UPI003A0FDD7F
MEHLTIKEKQVVQVFWRNEQCLSVSDVTLLLPDESKNTIAAVITKLLSRNCWHSPGTKIYSYHF